MLELALKGRLDRMRDKLHRDPHSCSAAYLEIAENDLASAVTPDFVRSVRAHIASSGFAVITTDLDDVAPDTPADYREPYVGPYYPEAVLALVGRTLGTLCSYSVQHDGRIFHDIIPMQSHSTKQTFASSAIDLEMHTELAFVENPPDYLMLYCIRPDREGLAETHFYDSRLALTQVPKVLRDRLCEPGYAFDVDEGATVEEARGQMGRNFPIIEDQTLELLRYDIDLCTPVKPIYKDALSRLHEALKGMKISLRLRTGQLVVIDNRRIVHSRNVFKAHFDGRDRWLKRAFVRKSALHQEN